MTDNMKKLLELASDNEELKAKLIAIAKENDISLTDADFELSEDALNAVSGGMILIGDDRKKGPALM